MKNFYEMTMLLEQAAQLAKVEDFPHDFEHVLNFIAGGNWSFVTDKDSPVESVTNLMGDLDYFLEAKYRGMSESGRHYVAVVGLYNPVGEARGGKVFKILKTWKQSSSYSPAGSQGVAPGSPDFYFLLHTIDELGPDTDGTVKKEPDERSEWERAEAEKNMTTQQRNIQTVLDKLNGMKSLFPPKKKWTPQRSVYRAWGGGEIKNARPVDLAKQMKDIIAKHEAQNPSFDHR